jgi:hypothetical protein
LGQLEILILEPLSAAEATVGSSLDAVCTRQPASRGTVAASAAPECRFAHARA